MNTLEDQPGKNAVQLRSCLLPRLEEIGAAGGIRSVLELGVVVPENIAVYSRWGARITCCDLSEAVFGQADFRTALEEIPDGSFDLILLWDLTHYLANEDFARVMNALESRLSARGYVLLLAPIQPNSVLAAPQRYRIGAAGGLEAAPVTGIPTPKRYPRSQRALTTICQKFTRERTYLLKNGLQEYLFRSRPIAESTALATAG